MKIHLLLTKNGDEVINYNDVIRIEFFYACIEITTKFFNDFWDYSDFDKIEVDYYD